jgi:O-antigen/teichoic acid export membrane protein
MNSRPEARTELLTSVPREMRSRIVSGMRWTVWLSVIAAPFSYCTNILLARVGPEVLGTYGLLGVYMSLVTCIFYLGGDAVCIKFIPELEPPDRLPFFASYFTLICLTLLPWLVVAYFWPAGTQYIFGREHNPSFYFVVIALSPVYILFLMVAAALKGTLEIRSAQIVLRMLPIGAFLFYLVLFFGFKPVLAARATGIIWGIFLGITGVAAISGFRRLLHLPSWQGFSRHLRFQIPQGFWRFTLATQQSSVLGFFISRTDYLLIINFAGLSVLGKYVALMTLPSMIPVINNYFLDTLLPSLTNLIAARNWAGASEVLCVHMRILFVISAASTYGLILFAAPLTAVFGSKYTSLVPGVILGSVLIGIASPGLAGGTMLISVGKQQRTVWLQAGQLVFYVLLFFALWPRFQLLGAAVAYGISILVSYLAMLVVAKRSVPIAFAVSKDYFIFAFLATGCATLALLLMPLGVGTGILSWLLALGFFLLIGRYRLAECKQLVGYFLPSFLSTPRITEP